MENLNGCDEGKERKIKKFLQFQFHERHFQLHELGFQSLVLLPTRVWHSLMILGLELGNLQSKYTRLATISILFKQILLPVNVW